MNHEETKELTGRSWDERWLEEALTNYGVAEPRPGLEMRILAGLESRAVLRQRRWTFAFAALAAGLFVVLIAEMRHTNSRTVPNVASNTRLSSGSATFPNMGNKLSSQSRRTPGQGTREHGPTALRGKPSVAVTHGQSPDGHPSDSQPDDAAVAEREPPVSDLDQSDAEAPSSDVVAKESTSSADSSAASAAEQRSMPEIRISGLNIKPIQIKEISSGRTTD